MSQNPIIKKGYKQTEVGMIPEDWEVVPLEEISDKRKQWSITGGPFGSNLKASDYTNVGVQIIQLQNIGDGYFDNENQIYTSKEKADELKSCNIYPGEIIISKMGDPVARACLIPNFQKRFVMSSDGIRLLINRDENVELYILNYINSPYFRNSAFAVSTGSTRLRIGLPELKGLLVVKPSKDEQSAIASILSDTDALIENLDTLIEKKKAIKQGTMQELLTGKRRLPGFSGEWIERQLIQIADFYDNLRIPIKESKRESGTTPYYGANGIQGYINGYTHDGEFVLLAEDGANNLSNYPVIYINGKAWVNNHAHVIQGKSKITNTKYLSYSLKTVDFLQILVGGTRTKLNGSAAKTIKVRIPNSIIEQIAIVTILSNLDREIEILEQQRVKYIHIKQAMIQQLLTGNIRVYGHN